MDHRPYFCPAHRHRAQPAHARVHWRRLGLPGLTESTSRLRGRMPLQEPVLSAMGPKMGEVPLIQYMAQEPSVALSRPN